MMEESSFLNPARAVALAGIHEGHLVADLGAGSGFFTRAAARAVGPETKVWAVDSSRELLSRIHNLATAEGLHNVEILTGDVSSPQGTDLPPAHFDFVIIANTLFTLEDTKPLAAEARRILKKTGRALVIDWRDSFGGLGPHQSHVVSASQARKLFESEGFNVVQEIHAGNYHWGFVVKKNKA